MVDANSVGNGVSVDKLSSGFTNFMHGAGFWIIIVFAAILLGFILYLMWYLMSFNIACTVEERMRNNAPLVTQRRAKIIYDRKKDGDNVIQRLKIFGYSKEIMFPVYVKDLAGNMIQKEFTDKKGVPIPTLKSPTPDYFELIGLTKKGKYCLRLLKEGDELTIVPWNNTDVSEYLRVSKPIRQQWANNVFREHMELFKPKQGFFEKYGSMIMMGGTLIVILIIFVVLFNKLDVLKEHAAAINNYASALGDLTKAIRETHVQQVV